MASKSTSRLWGVERCFAWLSRNRRQAKDERNVQTSETLLEVAATRLVRSLLAAMPPFHPAGRADSGAL